MSEVIVVASTGVRDVRYKPDEKALFHVLDGRDARAVGERLECGGNLRAISNKLLDEYRDPSKGEERKKRLRFPILRPALEYILDQLGSGKVDRLLLIVTDQDADNSDPRDTVFCGQLLELLVRDEWDHAKVGEIKHDFLVIRRNPHVADEMYSQIRDKLVSLRNDHPEAGLYVLTSPGIPAITDGLRHAGMNVFRDRCKVMEVDRPANDPDGAAEGKAREVLLAPYVKDGIRRGVEALVRKQDYAGALGLLEDSPEHKWPCKLVQRLKNTTARVNLCADPASGAGGHWLATELWRINEVRFLVDLSLKQERFAEALLRVQLFREASQAVFSVGLLGKQFQKWLYGTVDNDFLVNQGHGRLKEKLSALGSGDEYWLRESPERIVAYKYAAESLLPHSGLSGAALSEFVTLLDHALVRDMARLRNGVVHQPAGVSRNQIEETIRRSQGGTRFRANPIEYFNGHLERTADALCRGFGVPPARSPYSDIEKEVLRDLNA